MKKETLMGKSFTYQVLDPVKGIFIYSFGFNLIKSLREAIYSMCEAQGG